MAGRQCTQVSAPAGLGQTHGLPALRLNAGAASVSGLVFQSADLPANWARLDEFEGSAYQRVETDALLADGRSEIPASMF